MKSSYSGLPEGLPIILEPTGPNFAPHPVPGGMIAFEKQTFKEIYDGIIQIVVWLD